MYCDAGYDYRLTLTSNGSSEQTFEIPLSGNLTGWQNVCFTLTPGGAVRGYLNGRLEFTGAFTGTNIFTQATDQNGLYIGDGPVSGALEDLLRFYDFQQQPQPQNKSKRCTTTKNISFKRMQKRLFTVLQMQSQHSHTMTTLNCFMSEQAQDDQYFKGFEESITQQTQWVQQSVQATAS